jgi:N-sulfoglucosamine sulfohydrolase
VGQCAVPRAAALLVPLTLSLALVGGGDSRPEARQVPRSGAPRPNIVLAIADDWSFPHASAYGDRVVRTPNFDRVAREGARFTHAFAAAPSCSPSRAALLTGQAVHRLQEGGNLWGTLPSAYAVYPDLLERAGYAVGFTGKGWGPGQFEPGGRTRNPAGPTSKALTTSLSGARPERHSVSGSAAATRTGRTTRALAAR